MRIFIPQNTRDRVFGIPLPSMKHLLSLFFLLTTIIPSSAQQLLHCGADEMRIKTLKANPKVAEAVIRTDAELERFTQQFAERKNERGGGIYTIPVVFHVIHKYGNENISREQILDGLNVLNNTFRKQAADTADIITEFKPVHADCEIEFRSATKDPEGECHSGINRIASTLTTVGDHQVKELVHWNPSMYLNVYVVSNAAGLAGHAVWPADADTIPEWDGIVIAHNYVGAIGTSDQTQSVVFAHEVGHFLNLHHIWGGNNVPDFYYLPVGQASNCSEDDLVGDTPKTIGWSNCDLNASSCGNTVDNVQNAMDYSYCNIMFTEGQKVRMRAALNSTVANRNDLWSISNLIATGVLPEPAPLCAADFTSDTKVVCPHIDNTVTFSNTSYHGDVDSLLWTFPEGFPPFSEQQEPTIAYSTSGKHDVTLQVYANGLPETLTRSNYISVLQDSIWPYPLWESFEGQPSLNGLQWFGNSMDTDNEWELTDAAAHSGNWSAWVDNWDTPLLTIDELYGPPIDLENATQMKLAFKYAFTGIVAATNSTKLQVQMTRNCENSWSTRLTIAGDDLETVPPQITPFIPTSSAQWQQGVVNVPTSYLVDGLRFRFVFTSAGNNRLYLDDINMDITAGIEESASLLSDMNLYPNPATDILTVQFDLLKPTVVKLSLLNLLGQTVSVISEHSYPIGAVTEILELEGYCAGMYLIKLEAANGGQVKLFVVE